MFQTFDDEKMRLLTCAVLNVGGFDYLGSFAAQFFARTLDAISAAEVAFLAKHRSVEWFSFTSPREEKSTY
jgi:hypothetical protein